MDTFTRDQKIALLVVPMLLFGMLGVSYASAAGRDLTRDEEITLRRAHVTYGNGSEQEDKRSPLRIAIEEKDYDLFVKALSDTAFHESATREVFDTLVHMYDLHTHGKHAGAERHFHDALYSA